MSLSRYFIFNGHPSERSLCGLFADSYETVLREAGLEVQRQDLSAMQFDANLAHGYHERMDLEPDLVTWRENIHWAEHLVWFYPVWWGSMPARLKGVIDRAFLPGFAMNYHEKDPMWDPLLKGRSADVFLNADAPALWDLVMYGRPARNQVKNLVLGYAGIKPVRVTQFGGMRMIKPGKIERYRKTVIDRARKQVRNR